MKYIICLIIYLGCTTSFGQKFPDYSRERLLLEWKNMIGGSTYSGYCLGSEFSFHKKRNVIGIKFTYNYQGDQLDWRELKPDTKDEYSNDKLIYLGLNYGRDFQIKRLVISPQIGFGYVKYFDEHLGWVHVKECTGWIITTCNEYDHIDQKFDYYEGLGANIDLGTTFYASEVLGINFTTSLITSKYQTLLNLSGGFVFCLNPKTQKKLKENR